MILDGGSQDDGKLSYLQQHTSIGGVISGDEMIIATDVEGHDRDSSSGNTNTSHNIMFQGETELYRDDMG